MKREIKYISFFSIVFILLDQVIKLTLSNILNLNQSVNVIKNFFSITLVHNIGAAFSILMGKRLLLILIGIIALIVLFIYIKKLDNISRFDILTYSLLIGGILGNLIDRIIYGYVIDYLSFNIFGYLFPIFNLADIFICISVFLMIIEMLRVDLCKK